MASHVAGVVGANSLWCSRFAGWPGPSCCQALLLLLVLGAVPASLTGADKPAVAPARWGVKADPPAEPVKWPEKSDLSIPQPARLDHILFPSRESEFVVVGLGAYESERGELWSLVTGKRVGAIQGTPAKATKRALSPDGKYMALAVLDRSQANDVEVWSLETGKRVSSFQADDRSCSMTILDFAGPGEVLTYTFGQINGKWGHHLRVWDALTGAPSRQMDLEKNLSGDTRYDVSPGGNWLASIVNPDVALYDLQTGQIKAQISPPTKTEAGEYVSIDTVRFSQDGSELALLAEGQKSGVLKIIDVNTGAEKLKHEFSASMKSSLQYAASYKGPQIEFVSHPAGFLWHGEGFIERETGFMIWRYQQGVTGYNHWKRILTPGGLVVSTGDRDSGKIETLAFPAAQLEKTLAAYRSDGPAIIKPGEKVKLTVKVGDVRFGKPDEAKKSIEEVLTERLAEDGLEVDDEGATVLNIQYKEMAGKTLQEVKGGDRLGRGGTATGKTVQSTAGEVQIKWTTKDGKTKIYEQNLNLDPSFLSVRTEGDMTDEMARKQVFAILKIRLAGLPMPYFVPQDKDLAVLPMTTLSEPSAPATGKDAAKKKIEAKKKMIKKGAK
ncbi:MAG: WD40 repeat domain-containing protein [Planctomycetes bacterium]|nr:WD40 repeat domain-containing protein [Planctomycetota bacterium]